MKKVIIIFFVVALVCGFFVNSLLNNIPFLGGVMIGQNNTSKLFYFSLERLYKIAEKKRYNGLFVTEHRE